MTKLLGNRCLRLTLKMRSDYFHAFSSFGIFTFLSPPFLPFFPIGQLKISFAVGMRGLVSWPGQEEPPTQGLIFSVREIDITIV